METRPKKPVPFPISLSRRGFLRASGRWGAAALAAGAVPSLWPAISRAQDLVIPGKERMIVRSSRYLDLEMPVHLLDSFLTPVDLFYVRNHLAQPSVNLPEWRLAVTGEVERPLELTLDDLGRFDQAAVANTLECAGNGRALHRPRVAGIQWVRGAVGNAEFAGARLADVLRRAGVKATGKHVLFDGLDEPPGKVPDFQRSIPIEKAMDGDTLLATHMNGAPLRIEHGFPCRALVPGWLGAASVKWLIEVRVVAEEFDGTFMKPGYRFPRKPLEPGAEVSADEMDVITALPVKSILAWPADGAHVRKGPLRIRGAAWAGEESVARVDVSVDGGQSWKPVRMTTGPARYAWCLWEYEWTPPEAGVFTVRSRATDSSGRTQPMEPAWNPPGYLYNAVDRARLYVEA